MIFSGVSPPCPSCLACFRTRAYTPDGGWARESGVVRGVGSSAKYGAGAGMECRWGGVRYLWTTLRPSRVHARRQLARIGSAFGEFGGVGGVDEGSSDFLWIHFFIIPTIPPPLSSSPPRLPLPLPWFCLFPPLSTSTIYLPACAAWT